MPSQTPAESTSSSTVTFDTSNQSMWGTGSIPLDQTLNIVSVSTGNLSLGVLGLDASASASASLGFQVEGAPGDISINYPVDVGFKLPNEVAPGQAFTVDTTGTLDAGGGASLTATLPSFSAQLEATLSADASLGFLGDNLGSFNYNQVFPIGPDITSSQSNTETATVDGVSGTFTYGIPTSYSNTPTSTTGTTGNLPALTLDGVTAPVITASTDLIKDLAGVLANFDPEEFGSLPGILSNSVSIPILGTISYDLAAAVLTGAIDLAQQFTFDPTAVDVTITAPQSWDQSVTVPLGQDATFTVPAGWTGPIDLTTSYQIEGNLVSQTGIEGTIGLDLSLLSGDVFGHSFSAYNHNFQLYNSGPVYLYNPGGSEGFPVAGFNTVTGSLTTDLGTGDVTTVGNQTIDASAFTANQTALIQTVLDTVTSSDNDTVTNYYDPNAATGSPTAITGDLNIEVVNETGSVTSPFTLPNGFAAGILEPGLGSATLIGNSTDALLAAAPGAGDTYTLESGNDSDTLVGGPGGTVDFDITSAFAGVTSGGEISGDQSGDTIDLEGVPYSISDTVALDPTSNSLMVSAGGQSYDIRLDPTQGFHDETFYLSDDGSGGIDIGLLPGNLAFVSSGVTSSNYNVVSGLTLEVKSGGTISGVTVALGGTLELFGGAIVSGTIAVDAVAAGGTLEAGPGYTLGNSNSFSDVSGGVLGATVAVASGGTASGLVISASAFEFVSAGGTDSGTLLDGGDQLVFGTASGVVIGTAVGAARQVVESGGVAISATIAPAILGPPNNQVVSSGGTANSTLVEILGYQVISAGGIASGTTVDRGGTETVSSGGFDVSATISGQQFVYGTATSDTVVSGGTEVVGSGGIAGDTTVDSGGVLNVEHFGFVSGGAIVDSGATETIGSGGAGDYTAIFGNTFDSGTAEHDVVEAGGSLTIESAPFAIAFETFVASGGTETVLSGGFDGLATVIGQQLDFGTVSGVSILSGGSQIVESGGVAIDTFVYSGGTETVSAGGSGFSPTIAGQQLDFGGVSGAFVLSGGTQTIESGGTASATTISASGTETVNAGGTDTSATIAGLQLDSGTATDDTVAGGGIEYVSSGGTASGTVVESGGELIIASGGSESGTVVESGGKLIILTGASESGAVVENGGILVLATSVGNSDTNASTAPSTYVLANAGDDSITPRGSDDTIIGGSGADTIDASGSNDSITGGTGPDTITAIGTDEIISAGSGNTSMTITGTGDTVAGGPGADTTSVSGLDDTVTGGNGPDTITAIGTDEVITAGSGNTSMTITGTGDTVLGGSGADTIDASGSSDSITGGTGPDTITAIGTDEVITAGSGNTSMTITGTGDTVTAGSGFDTIDASGSSDSITGGTGPDTITAIGTDEIITAGSGNTSMTITGTGDTVTAGSGADTISVSGLHDVVTGGAGPDTISVSGVSDTVFMATGVATITVNGHADTVEAGSQGSFTAASIDLTGGSNAVFTDGSNSYSDTIVGFSQASGDTIHLTGSDTSPYAVAHAVSQNSGQDTLITLNDGSTILLKGVTSINASFFS